MTVLVTGAGGGIGRGIVERALQAGNDVLAHDLDRRRLAELPAATVRIAGDLAAPEHLDELAATGLECGVSAVVAAHGMGGAVPFAELDGATCRSIMEVNCLSVMGLAAQLGPQLGACGGAFVAIASQAALRPERELSAYCSSKWALLQWVRSTAADAQRAGYALRVLCPGRTDSPMLHTANARIASATGVTLADYEAATLAEVPLGRYATVEEMAGAALLLASPLGAPVPSMLAVTGGEVWS